MIRESLDMDTDLEVMRSITRFRPCVELLIEPLLSRRTLTPMPCKHVRTFELADQWRRERCEEQGVDDVEDDTEMPKGYCDCGKFNRRDELWEIGELTIKRGLTRTQMRELAHVLLLVTGKTFTFNVVKRTMLEMFSGRYKAELKALKRLREGEGVSFADASERLVAEWQFRMMPNA